MRLTDALAALGRRELRQSVPIAVGAVVAVLSLVATNVGAAPAPPFVPFVLDDGYGKSGFDQDVGIVAIGSLRSLDATGQAVLTGARPVHVDDGMEIIAVRAAFWGLGGRTNANYQRVNGIPAIDCSVAPVTGFWATYPVEGLAINPHDHVEFIVWARVTKPGVHSVTGLRVSYRLADGTVGTATTKSGWLQVGAHTPGDDYEATCGPHDGDDLVRPAPGFPS